jgi:hypothetical protein
MSDRLVRQWPARAALLGLIAAVAATPSARAQADKLGVVFSDSKTALGGSGELVLRPNVAGQAVYAWIKNPTANDQELTIQLKAASDGEALTTADVIVPAGKNAVIPFRFKKGAAPAAAGAPAAPMPEWPELAGGKFQITVTKKGAKNAPPLELPVTVRVLQPSSYLQADAVYTGGANNMLEVNVSARPDFTGPPCVVKLALTQERLPGLEPDSAPDATLQQKLTKAGDTVKLTARNLRFGKDAPARGYISVTADGYTDAFVFEADFTRAGGIGNALPPRAWEVQQFASRYTRPTEKFSAPFAVFPRFGDTLHGADVIVQASLADATLRHTGVKNQQVRLSPESPDGGLVFRTEVRDWTPTFDLTGVRGKRILKIQLLANGRELAAAADTEIAVDDTPPLNVRFVDPPRQLERGAKLKLQASGDDPESGIKEVVFFVGKAVDGKEGKERPKDVTTVAAKPDMAGRIWAGELAIAGDEKSPVSISVQFVNNVNMSTFATIPVELIAQAPGGAAAKTGKVKAKVVEAGIEQKMADVYLVDDKGKVVSKKDKSDDNGFFVFSDVAPGAYKVVANKNSTGRTGTESVTVEAGKEATPTVKLLKP